MTVDPLRGVFLRVVLMYAITLALVRFSGKRDVGAVAPEDFAVTLVIGDLFDDMFFGEAAFSAGVVAMSTIVFLHGLASFLSYRYPSFGRVIGSDPVAVVKGGRFDQEGCRKEKLRPEEAMGLLRLQGVEDVGELERAVLEPNGDLSLRKKEDNRTAQKRDLSRLKALL